MSGFTQVLNDVITDRRISPTALRVALYLGSKPEGWTVREHNVCDALGIGERAYKTAMRDLEASGYIARGAVARGVDGKTRREPPTLVHGRVIAGRTKGALRSLGDEALVAQPINNTDNNKDRSTKAAQRHLGTGPDLLPRASEGASAPERVRPNTCGVCKYEAGTESVLESHYFYFPLHRQ
jgi:hypothetical protein